MADKINKVKYGLKNVHYAKLTFAADGKPSFGTPVAIPGAVNLSLSRQGETLEFYADDGVYFELGNNAGYDGTLEIALIPEAFRTDILGETKDDKGVLTEVEEQTLGRFALLFEFAGDAKAVRHVMYNCTATQDEVSGKSREQNIELETESLSIKARALKDGGRVKAKTGDGIDETVYGSWYDSVYMPTEG